MLNFWNCGKSSWAPTSQTQSVHRAANSIEINQENCPLAMFWAPSTGTNGGKVELVTLKCAHGDFTANHSWVQSINHIGNIENVNASKEQSVETH